MPPSRRVLVLGNDMRSFLGVIRSLGRAGLEVHAGWADLESPALRSRYLKAVHHLPRYSPDCDEWLAALVRLLKKFRFDMVAPCHDEGVLALNLRRRELAAWTLLCIPSEPAYQTCSDKGKTYALAERLSLPLPRQQQAASIREIKDLAIRFGLPLVLKPLASVSHDEPGIRREVRKVRAIEEVEAAAAPFLSRGPLLVQENFTGIGVGVEVLCREGKVLAAFQHQRVHEPLLGGGSSYRKSVPLTPALAAAARLLMKELRYTGVAMVEFKVNPRTGAWVLIEINGRFWGSLPLTIAAGADFPRYLYEMTVEGREAFPQGYRTGLYCRNWRLDVGWLRRNLRADRADPALMTLPLWKLALEPLHLFQERSDTFTIDDPFPGISEVAQLARQAAQAVCRRVPLIRSGMRRRARNAVRKARRILIVCKGNICRSPFAEAYLRRHIGPGIGVQSAGHYPWPGRACPAAAREAAAHFGIDLVTHRSRTVSQEQVEWADLILIFEPEQESALPAAFPRVRNKVHYLGALLDRGGLSIRDPWGGTAKAFIAVYRRIADASDRLLELKSGAALESRKSAARPGELLREK